MNTTNRIAPHTPVDFALTHRKGCPATWSGFHRQAHKLVYWWGTRLRVVRCSFGGNMYACGSYEWRFTLRQGGFLCGHFKTSGEALQHGKRQIKRCRKYGNDWGVPGADLCSCFEPKEDDYSDRDG